MCADILENFCPQCRQKKTPDCFGTIKGEPRRTCKSCRHDDYLVGRAQLLEKRYAAYHAQSPDEKRAFLDIQNVYRAKRSMRERQVGKCSKCLARAAEIGSHCLHCREYMNQESKKLSEQVLTLYGGFCIVCGENQLAFLAIDHMNNDGAEHRRSVGNGHRLYRWLRTNNFPSGYQVLCHNHNWLKYLSLQSDEKTYHQLWYAMLRQETIDAYNATCACCGESYPDVLTIDHVNGGGNEQRRVVGAGSAFYSWLRKQGFPQGEYQCLCFNCNRAKFYYGVCPHQS